jgi:hypothetical protein
MANTTTRLYIRCATGYSTPPKKLVDPPAGQSFYIVWYQGNRKRAWSVGRLADNAQVALINQQSELRKAAINPQGYCDLGFWDCNPAAYAFLASSSALTLEITWKASAT